MSGRARLVFAILALGLAGGAGAGCRSGDEECAPLAAASAAALATADAAAPCAKTEDCPRSCLCRDLGRCAKGPDGACVVGEDAHCKASRVCKLVGHCTASGAECVAASDADCRASSMCESGGKCVARDGRCVAGAAIVP